MNHSRLIIRFCAAVVLAASLLSCTKSQSGDDSPSGGSGATPTGPGTTQCGVVVNGALKNPVKLKDGEELLVQGASGANLVIAAFKKTPNKPFLIKLHGVGAARNARKQKLAIQTITSLGAKGAFFFKPFVMCDTYLGSETVAVGALLTPDGVSIGEQVLEKGYALPESSDVCNGFLLKACYDALAETNATMGGVGCQFLWKPVADKDGNLVIHAMPCNTRIVVNGQELQDAGSGNGRCSTGRGNKPGCAYGRATVQVFDRDSGLPYEFADGSTKLVVNGCDRVEPPCAE